MLQPKLETLLRVARMALRQEKVEVRRFGLLDIFLAKIAALAESANNTNAMSSLGRDHCTCRNDYVRLASRILSASIESTRYTLTDAYGIDELVFLTNEDWACVLDGKLRIGLAAKEQAARKALDAQLVYGISGEMHRPDVPPHVGPLQISGNHPLAFLRYTGEFLNRSRFVRDKLFTYEDVLSFLCCLSVHRDCLANLMDMVHTEGKPTSTQYDTWVLDTRAIRVGNVLLEQLGYRCPVSMNDMLMKGSVFVCMCCPKEGRMRMGWRELVSM